MLVAVGVVLVASQSATAHPLGNFTINQFSRLELNQTGCAIHHVVDMAEIPTLQEQAAIDSDSDGLLSESELDAYARRTAGTVAESLVLDVDGTRADIRVQAAHAWLTPGAGDLHTLRLECDFDVAIAPPSGAAHAVRFENRYLAERLGWREIAINPATGTAVFDSSAFANTVTNELRAYPEAALSAPLDERVATLKFAIGAPPSGAAPLRLRDGKPLVAARDPLAELISVPQLTPWVGLLGLLIAAGLGALHALSPGHGKTVVGAYLVGSRGTPRHALFLGLTVTVTHTAGVYALGLITLFASRYVLPEQLFPVLGVASGAVVLGMGLSMFVSRLKRAAGLGHVHADHSHDGDEDGVHSHGGVAHSHLPPGADGSPITMRSLLALGVSGGLLPCPSALVVLLAAISLQRVGYGLLLVVAFSAGLAFVLTAIGLVFVYAGRFVTRRAGASISRLARVVPIASAAVISVVGAAICAGALEQAGIDVRSLIAQAFTSAETPSFAGAGALGVLGLGLLFGLKHATEADHIVAVTTIVSEQRKIWQGAFVGALWGLGHTAALVVVGTLVLALRIAIPELVASWLEFGVALMIIGLGAAATVRGLRGRGSAHVHAHAHEDLAHAHIHFHDDAAAVHGGGAFHTHTLSRVGIKPVVVGAMHGLAGSAALTLLVLTQIPSPALGVLYLLVFGIGSIGGMLAMSGLVGIPFVLTTRRLSRTHHVLQIAAGVFSLLFGVWYAFESGAVVSSLGAAFR